MANIDQNAWQNASRRRRCPFGNPARPLFLVVPWERPGRTSGVNRSTRCYRRLWHALHANTQLESSERGFKTLFCGEDTELRRGYVRVLPRANRRGSQRSPHTLNCRKG